MALNENTEILETLGQGSFGVVYVARVREGAIQRTVVLKVLKQSWSDNDEVLTRSRDEAALLALLNHDSIVKVEQLTDIGGRPTVVMEYVQGLSLDHVLSQHGPFPVGVALSIIAKVASALDAAYNTAPPGMGQPLRVIHRDIKPSNVMMSVSGAVKVLDFGTARAEFGAREAMTQALTLGSPLYMAPECFDGAPPAPEVDVYALGATLYEMLSGKPLGRLSIDRDKHGQKLKDRLAQLSPAELADAPQAINALRNLIARMVRYDAERRPTSRDVRRLSREFVRRIPRLATPSLDQFAEVVVEDLFRNRQVMPPIDIEGTMDPAGGSSGSISGGSSSGLRGGGSSGLRGGSSGGLQGGSSGGLRGGSSGGLRASPGPSDYMEDAATMAMAAPHSRTPPPTDVMRPGQDAPTDVMAPAAALASLGGGAPMEAAPMEAAPPLKPLGEHDDTTDDEGRSPIMLGIVLGLVGVMAGLAIVFAMGQLMQDDPPAPEPVEQPAPRVDEGAAGASPAETEAAAAAEATPPPAIEASPKETAPAETTPAETAPAETKPAETAPAETKPAETKPAETAPAETKPAETAPAETKPAETKPAETAPAETKPKPAAGGATVRVVSIPAGATVTIGGQSAQTPGELNAPAGSAQASVKFPDGVSGTCSVTVSDSGRLAFRSDGMSVTCP